MSTRYYEKNRTIEDGIKIKGTTKIFKNAIGEDCMWSDTSFNKDLTGFIEIVKRIEEGYSLDTVQDINKMNIEYINDVVIIFRCLIDNEIKYFFLNKEAYGNEISMPFKTFSSCLTVPVSFSKRNPGDLNEINFKYYQDTDSDVLVPIKIIYNNEIKEFDFQDKNGNDRHVLAYKIETLIKGRTKDLTETVDIRNEIPLLHKILNNVKEEIYVVDPEVDIKLHSYILGYDGFNKGRHFVRLVIDNKKSIGINDEMYQFGLDIETDFSGNNKDAGTVFIMPTLFRVVGETAFNIQLDSDVFLNMMNAYTEGKMSEDGIYPEDESYDTKLNYYIEEFTSRFDEGCAYLRVKEINRTLSIGGFRKYLNSWINESENINHLRYRMSKTKENLSELRRNDNQFITDIILASKKIDFKAKEAIKYIILEYVAGVVSGEQIFEDYLDIVHFLNMIGLAYTTDIQRDINQKVFQFVEILEGIKEYSIFDKYRRKLRRDFREKV